jgi:hypothetical protein
LCITNMGNQVRHCPQQHGFSGPRWPGKTDTLGRLKVKTDRLQLKDGEFDKT